MAGKRFVPELHDIGKLVKREVKEDLKYKAKFIELEKEVRRWRRNRY